MINSAGVPLYMNGNIYKYIYWHCMSWIHWGKEQELNIQNMLHDLKYTKGYACARIVIIEYILINMSGYEGTSFTQNSSTQQK